MEKGSNHSLIAIENITNGIRKFHISHLNIWKGRPSNRKGIKLSEETKKKLSESHKGQKPSFLARLRASEALKGKNNPNYGGLSKIHKQHISESLKKSAIRKRVMDSKEYREKMSRVRRGHVVLEETRDKISKSLSSSNHFLWKGGVSYEPYGLEFNNQLKEKIRERDDFTCQICKALENGIKLDIHHLDSNKKNNNMNNLISLCKRCHMSLTVTNFWYNRKLIRDA